jgi:site-specific DNA-cytosine methylase
MRQTAVSLSAGIGGFDLALENNDIQVVANCEIEEQVNQHRYKQIGNAVAIPVVDWIIKGIVAENDLK